MIYYSESSDDKQKIEKYRLPFIGSKSNVDMDDMIMNVKFNKILSLIFILTYNGNIYYVHLDGIRHRKIDLIENKLFYNLKYFNINKILFTLFNNLNYMLIFGQLSFHQLFIINDKLNKIETSSSKFIPQFNGILDCTKAKIHKSFCDENIYVTHGYNHGGCIAKYSCIIPTESVLDKPQKGYEYLSKILNVTTSNKQQNKSKSLLIFSI